MTDSECQVVGCTLPSVTSFLCKIKVQDKMVTENVRVCSSHEKAFEVLRSKERFVN